MAYTSKYTGSQIENKLDGVFQSKLQDKTVEITDNGVTEVTPDTGFIALNSVSVSVNVPTSGEGGGSASKWKYYDCLGDKKDDYGYIEHYTYLADNVKIIDSVTGNLMIAPEAYIDSDEPNTIVAVAYNMDKRVYADGKWIPLEEFIAEAEDMDFSSHTEITEEEFYHIPEDVVWNCNTNEGCKEAFEALWKLCERYDGKFNSSEPLPLIFFYKSIDLLKFGATASYIFNYRDNGDVQFIFFDQYNELVLTRRGESYNLILE